MEGELIRGRERGKSGDGCCPNGLFPESICRTFRGGRTAIVLLADDPSGNENTRESPRRLAGVLLFVDWSDAADGMNRPAAWTSVPTPLETGVALASGGVAEIVRFPPNVTPRCRKSHDFHYTCSLR